MADESRIRPDRAAQVQGERRRRSVLGPDRNLKLFVPESEKDPDFVYRWVNNRPGRIKQLTQMDDYDIVSAPDNQIDVGTSEGTVVKRTVDRNEGGEAVLLRKPRKFYEADKAEEQRGIDATDELMRQGAVRDSEGLSGSEAYVPGRRGQQGRNIVAGR